MSWLDLHKDRVIELLKEDYYPSNREIPSKESGTFRRFRAECRTGYMNIADIGDDGERPPCCPTYVGSPPKRPADRDLEYAPVSPMEFLGDSPGRTQLFLAQLTTEMDYERHLRNKDGEKIRPPNRKPIEATPVQEPIVIERRSGDWTGFAHWEEGGAFFSSWGYPTTEPDFLERQINRGGEGRRKEHHFSLDITTKDLLFYRYDIEQYIVNIWGIWKGMTRHGLDFDRDGVSFPTHSKGLSRYAEATVTIIDYNNLSVGDSVILRATKEPTKDIRFPITELATDTSWLIYDNNRAAAFSLADVINKHELFSATAYGEEVVIIQEGEGEDGETEVTLIDPSPAGMRKINFKIPDEGGCKPERTQNLLNHSDNSARHPQCRIWDMSTRWNEWVNGKPVY